MTAGVVTSLRSRQNPARNGAPGRIRTCDPRLRRPAVGSVINRRLSTTSPRWSGSREFTPILAALRRFIASHAITDLRYDHVNVPAAPGAGHEEPVFPWSRSDFRHHVLRLVRTNVPEIMGDLHTITDLSDPDQIRRDIDACATRWQLDKPWITRTMHRTVRFLAPGPDHAGQSAAGPHRTHLPDMPGGHAR